MSGNEYFIDSIVTIEGSVLQTSDSAPELSPGLKGSSPALTRKDKRIQSLETRFGEITVNLDEAIYFTHGILGIPGSLYFCLADFPSADMEQFKILQCVEDPDLSFVVVPAAADNQLIDQKDVLEACQILEAEEETLLMLFIVSVHENADGRRLSVNARAPICIDPSRKSGTQYVFSNKNYDIRHMIS